MDRGLVRNFSIHFTPRYAATRHQKRFSQIIRYQVYAEELGWEPLNEKQLEQDECDDYAHHCLLEHNRTGDFAGCVRLVVPPCGDTKAKLPFQQHDINAIDDNKLALHSQGRVGEISRLAVPNCYRRRASEAGKPFILDSHNPSLYTEEERRNFPNISIGLYLSAIAMVDLCKLDCVLVVMEPRLQRHLHRYGLCFQQISDLFEMKGERALYELPSNELTPHMNPQIRTLYDFIRHKLENQPWQQLPQSSQWSQHEPI
jgi:N-acyl amino acid synthase of PEP-CTERM/exosortase system